MNDKFTFGSAGLIHELEMGMNRAGGWDQSLVKLLSSGNHLVKVREYLRGHAEITVRSLSVPAHLSYEERVKRGQYSRRNSDLTEERFPVTIDQTGDWEWKLFHFGQAVYSADAIQFMKEDGYDAGRIGHLLAFREKHLEERWNYSIVGLGSPAKIHQSQGVPELGYNVDRCSLSLNSFHDHWHPDTRFLGVRRPSAA